MGESEDFPPPMPAALTREQAEGKVRKFEESLSYLLRSVSPEEFVPEAAKRLRQAAENPGELMQHYPPHVMVHAIEACCAYWQQWHYEPLTENRLRQVVNEIISFDDPALAHSIGPDSDLFEFM
jgi:hypothetical protein